MTKFTDLPRKIRDMIYTLCLKEDRAIFPYEERYRRVKPRAAVPRIALLHVSRSIRAEATIIFYSTNTWLIGPSLSANHHRFFESWESNKHLVRHVVLCVTHYDVPFSLARYLPVDSPYTRIASIENYEILAKAKTVFGKGNISRAICHSMGQILNGLGTLSTLIIEVQDLYPRKFTSRKGALKGMMCSFHERVSSLSASGCTTTVRGLRGGDEVMIVQSKWPFAVTETSPWKLHMW